MKKSNLSIQALRGRQDLDLDYNSIVTLNLPSINCFFFSNLTIVVENKFFFLSVYLSKKLIGSIMQVYSKRKPEHKSKMAELMKSVDKKISINNMFKFDKDEENF